MDFFFHFFFSFRITVTVPRAKPILLLHTTSPFEAKDRGAEIENGPTGLKSLLRAGGERGGGSGGGSSLLCLSVRRLSRSVGHRARGRASPVRREERRFGHRRGASLRPSVRPSPVVVAQRRIRAGRLGRGEVGGPWGRRRTAACLYQSQTLRTKYEAPVSAWG